MWEERLSAEECILPLFLALGISPDKRGYKYLKSAVLGYAASNGSMQTLNDHIAVEYLSSASSVEKDMRCALKISACDAWRKAFAAIVGYGLIMGRALPVKKFVAIIAEYLSFESNRRRVFALKTY